MLMTKYGFVYDFQTVLSICYPISIWHSIGFVYFEFTPNVVMVLWSTLLWFMNGVVKEWGWFVNKLHHSICYVHLKICTKIHISFQAWRTYECKDTYCQLRARSLKGITLFKDLPLRTRRALSLYKVYRDSGLLVLNRTLLNSINALLPDDLYKGYALSEGVCHFCSVVMDASSRGTTGACAPML